MPKDTREIEGPGLKLPDDGDLSDHPDHQMCSCGHKRWKHDSKTGICEKSRWCKCQGFQRASMELVVTKEEHRKDYEMIRQMGHLPAEQWPDARILAVRQMYGSNAQNSAQLALFMHIAQQHDLDPALNEIQLIPTSQGPKCYAGRDGFLKAASRQPHMYGGIRSGVVYASDDFRMKIYHDVTDPTKTIVDIHHEFDPRERKGRPHGAYAVVYDASGRPTYVYRETAKCQQTRSTYWDDDHVDDAIQNRAVGAALRRVVPLGGMLIFGEEPIGSTEHVERQVQRGTAARLAGIKASLGITDDDQDHGGQEGDQETVVTDESGQVLESELDRLLDEYSERYRVSAEAFIAWARAVQVVPDDLDEWTPDHKTVALHAMRDTEGLEMVKELANVLVYKVVPAEEQFEVLTEIANVTDREMLDGLVQSLQERRPRS